MLPPNAKIQRLDTVAVEPLSLADAKAYCRVETPDNDALFGTWITAARIKCEQMTDSSLTGASYRLLCDYLPFGGIGSFLAGYPQSSAWTDFGAIELPHPPLVGVGSISYVGTDGLPHTLPPSSYRVSPGTPGQVQPAFGTFWPFVEPEVSAVEIDYTCGLDATKLASVRQAMMVLVNHMYLYRDEDEPIPMQVAYILDPARYYGYA